MSASTSQPVCCKKLNSDASYIPTFGPPLVVTNPQAEVSNSYKLIACKQGSESAQQTTRCRLQTLQRNTAILVDYVSKHIYFPELHLSFAIFTSLSTVYAHVGIAVRDLVETTTAGHNRSIYYHCNVTVTAASWIYSDLESRMIKTIRPHTACHHIHNAYAIS